MALPACGIRSPYWLRNVLNCRHGAVLLAGSIGMPTTFAHNPVVYERNLLIQPFPHPSELLIKSEFGAGLIYLSFHLFS